MHLLSRPIASKSAVEAKGVETRDLFARERDARVKRIGLFSSYRFASDSHFADEDEVGRRKRATRKENKEGA